MGSVFIDANIPIYAAGTPHPLTAPCRAIILAIPRAASPVVTSSEVLQELLHHYLGRRRPDLATVIIQDFDRVLDGRIEAITREDILRAAEYSLEPRISSRDRVHLAVMERIGVTDIISSDRGFDDAPGVRRLDPLTLDAWSAEVFG